MALWETFARWNGELKFAFIRVYCSKLKQSQTLSVSFDSSKLEEFVSSTVDNFVTQFNIPLITVQETQKFIDNLSSSKATGADEISVKVLKLVSPVLV